MDLEVRINKRLGGLEMHWDCDVKHTRSGLFGPSGCGKTTLVNMLAGLVRPDRGCIRLNGISLYDSRNKIDLPPEKRRVGVVFQHARLFPHLNVKKNLYYGYKRTAVAARKFDPNQVIKMLRLEPLLARSVQSLSGGERQRVALGRTILASPLLVLLDEPLAGLDDTLKYQIIPELNELFETLSIPFLLISHSVREMQLMTSEVLIAENGKITHQVQNEYLTDAVNDRKSCGLIQKRKPTTRVSGRIPSYHLPDPGVVLARRPIF